MNKSEGNIRASIGRKFNKLTILDIVDIFEDDTRTIYIVQCLCECGNTCAVRWRDVRYNATKSCGCLKSNFNKSRGRAPGEASAHGMYMSYRRGAQLRNYDFDLTEDYFKVITKQNCHYCDSIPSGIYISSGSTTPYIYNGIDRVDNDKGYTVDNCVPCCWKCNHAKGTMSVKEFINWGLMLGAHLKLIRGET